MVTLNIPGRAYEYEYKGLSTDEKPADCAENSLFLELDTGKFYYFDGEAWNELGTGGGGDDPDVLYKGTLTLVLMEGSYVVNTDPVAFNSMPAGNDPVYLYVEDNLIDSGVWSEEQGGSGSYYEFGTDNCGIEYAPREGEVWGGTLWIADDSLAGDKLVEIRKSAK